MSITRLIKELEENGIGSIGEGEGMRKAAFRLKEEIQSEISANKSVWEQMNAVEPSDATIAMLPEDVQNYIKALEAIAPPIKTDRTK